MDSAGENGWTELLQSTSVKRPALASKGVLQVREFQIAPFAPKCPFLSRAIVSSIQSAWFALGETSD